MPSETWSSRIHTDREWGWGAPGAGQGEGVGVSSGDTVSVWGDEAREVVAVTAARQRECA